MASSHISPTLPGAVRADKSPMSIHEFVERKKREILEFAKHYCDEIAQGNSDFPKELPSISDWDEQLDMMTDSIRAEGQ